jgi:UDP-glucose 4-epimerase
MRILITGGAGFIGSHFVDILLKFDHEILVIDDLSSGNIKNLPHKIRFQKISILDPMFNSMLKAFNPESIFHFAAQIDVNKSTLDPIKDAELNIFGTLGLLEHCRNTGAYFVFASSGGAIYGEATSGKQSENHPEFPLNPYGVAKLTIDRYLHAYYHQYQMPFTSMRFSNVYGPRQNAVGEAGVVAIFINNLLKSISPIINGNGSQTRDFVFVKDLSKIAPTLIEKMPIGVYNLGTGIGTSIHDLSNLLIEKLGAKANLQFGFGPARTGEQQHSIIDPSKANQELGWIAQTLLPKGIEDTIEWFHQNLISQA